MVRRNDVLRRLGLACRRGLMAGGLVTAWGIAATDPARAADETVEQALCRMIEGAAAKEQLPVPFFTRLLWQESSFRSGVTSPAGAQGVAQFMPGTARERGLDDPFDPEQAIPASAALLAELSNRFGNIGLAAAAYNGGPTRVAAWLAGTGGLPIETEDYVLRITGRAADDWAADVKKNVPFKAEAKPPSCLEVTADLRIARANSGFAAIPLAPLAPWGVQLAGNFSKSIALASFERSRSRYDSILGDVHPMIIGTRVRTRGFHAFYRVRVPAETRAGANALCNKIRSVRGSCIVLRS